MEKVLRRILTNSKSTSQYLTMNFIRDLKNNHEALKKKIHNFRLPLSPFGRAIATCVYVSFPIVMGYYIMEATNAQAIKNLGRHGEKMRRLSDDMKSDQTT